MSPNEAASTTERDTRMKVYWSGAALALLADIELRLNPYGTELTDCPAAFWSHEGCNFIVGKTGEPRYRCQFYYRVHQMYGTGVEEYDDLSECVVTLLQVQADYVANQAAEN